MRNQPVSLAQGVYVALVTPRRPDTVEVDGAAYLEYLDKVTAAGVDGLVFFGSTGEFVHFDLAERMRLVGLAVRRCRVPVLVNVSHSTFIGVRDLADHAMDTGAQGLLVMPPYFYRYDDAHIEAFYESVCQSLEGRIPVYLYNIPQFTSPIGAKIMREMLGAGRFAGIKDSRGDWNAFAELLTLREQAKFQLLAGHERILSEALQAGTDGAVSGVGAAIPELPVALRSALSSGDTAHAERLRVQLDAILNWIEQMPTTMAIKEAARVRGWLKDSEPMPLPPEGIQRVKSFRQWIAAWLPETLEICSHRA